MSESFFECDATECEEGAVVVLVGESGDLAVCAEHYNEETGVPFDGEA